MSILFRVLDYGLCYAINVKWNCNFLVSMFSLCFSRDFVDASSDTTIVGNISRVSARLSQKLKVCFIQTAL